MRAVTHSQNVQRNINKVPLIRPEHTSAMFRPNAMIHAAQVQIMRQHKNTVSTKDKIHSVTRSQFNDNKNRNIHCHQHIIN